MIKKFWIYKITNTITGKIYVGQTTDFAGRMKAHKSMKDKGTIIVKSISKYGWNCHIVDILFFGENIDRKQANHIESYFIRFLNSYCKNNPQGMNLNEGDYIQKITIDQVIKTRISKFQKWAKKIGKFDQTISAYDKLGNLISEFSKGDIDEYLIGLGIVSYSKRVGLRQAIREKGFTCSQGTIVGFREDAPYQKYLEYYEQKRKGQKGRKVGDHVLNNLKKYHATTHDKQVVEIKSGRTFPSITAFAKNQGITPCAATWRLRNGAFDGEYKISNTG